MDENTLTINGSPSEDLTSPSISSQADCLKIRGNYNGPFLDCCQIKLKPLSVHAEKC